MIIGPKVHWKGGSGTLFSISWRVSCLVFQPLLQDVAQTNSPASLWSAGNSASLRKGHWRNQCGWTEVTRLRQENALLRFKSRDKPCHYDSMKFDPTEGLWKIPVKFERVVLGCWSSWSTFSKSPMQTAISWAMHWIRLCGYMQDTTLPIRADRFESVSKILYAGETEMCQWRTFPVMLLNNRMGEFHYFSC